MLASSPMAPYPGQGQPLPPGAGYTGEWISLGKYFLFEGITSNVVQVGHVSGARAIGFSAEYLAKLYNMPVAELFDANRKCELSINEAPIQAGTTPKTIIRTLGVSLPAKGLQIIKVEETLP